MKKIYTLLVVALLVPSLVLAAPKQRITMSYLKKQVASLLSENKALKAEIESLKALQTKTVTELTYCKANPAVIERITNSQQIVPVVVSSSYTPQQVAQQQEPRELRMFASPVTDGVEVNGVESIVSVRLQIQSVVETDIITVSPETVDEAYRENGDYIVMLPPESVTLTVTINGKVTTANIVVEDTPDKNNNSSKRVYMIGDVTADA